MSVAPGGDDPGRDDLAVPGVGQADDGDLGDAGVVVQELLDLGRIDVLAPPDDQLLAAADDPVVAVVALAGEVAGVKPAVGVDHPGGRLGVLVIAGHDAVAARAKLAGLAAGRPPCA